MDTKTHKEAGLTRKRIVHRISAMLFIVLVFVSQHLSSALTVTIDDNHRSPVENHDYDSSFPVS